MVSTDYTFSSRSCGQKLHTIAYMHPDRELVNLEQFPTSKTDGIQERLYIREPIPKGDPRPCNELEVCTTNEKQAHMASKR